jgi:hypothetical protein
MRTGKGAREKIANREKQIVWKYTGPHRAHEIQVLTTNGEPIEGEPLK